MLLPLPIFTDFIAAIGAKVFHRWDDITCALQGKKVAVLGAKAVGKTNFLRYVERGILIEKYT